jgi:hypothetical protein
MLDVDYHEIGTVNINNTLDGILCVDDINDVFFYDNYVACFNLNEYIKQNKNSYPSTDKIISQLEQDYNRCTITIDSQKLSSCELFIDHVQTYLYNDNTKLLYGMTYESLILLLCCQSSLCIPFEVIRNIYEHDDHYLTCNGTSNSININIILGDVTTITINTTFSLLCITTNKITKKISTCLTINLSENDEFSMGLMTWFYVNHD